jgi:hypothetical protein
MPWVVLLAMLSPRAISLTPSPFFEAEMAFRMAKALFMEGAPYPFLV